MDEKKRFWDSIFKGANVFPRDPLQKKGSERTDPIVQSTRVPGQIIGDILNQASPVNDADVWGELYQTSNNPNKKAVFNDNVAYLSNIVPERANEMAGGLGVIDDVFGADSFYNKAVDTQKLKDLVYKTGLHESLGGKHMQQQGGGPARGFYQVEPESGYNLLKTFNRMGKKSIDVINEVLGTQFKNRKEASGMSQEEMEQLLLDPKAGAMFAGAKYLQQSVASPKYKKHFLK